MEPLELHDLSRAQLAGLAREYMLASQLNDRTSLAGVTLSGLDLIQAAINEWMGASPIYTQRLQRAFGFVGDDVPTIFKGLQLDCGFAHEYMKVHYEVRAPDTGRFWLESCGPLLDVEPRGTEMVFGMCHTIEDPTFDATAVATNRRAQVRPVHRPPRSEPVDPDKNHCEWTVTIDPENDPVSDHPNLAAVRRSALASVTLDRSDPDPDDDGWRDYSGAVMEVPRLEVFSRDALELLCKELAVQTQLLVRSLYLSNAEAADEEVATEILESGAIGLWWAVSERLASILGRSGEDAGIDTVHAVLALHPAFQPREYQPISLTRDGDTLVLQLLDGPAASDDDGASWYSLLRSGHDAILRALVQAVDAHAQVDVVEGAAVPSWRISIDRSAEPAVVPDYAEVAHVSNTFDFTYEVPVEITPRRVG